MTWPFHFEYNSPIRTTPQILFDHLDDFHRLSGHMEKRSAAMAGSAMSIETDKLGGKEVGSVVRMKANMLGMRLELQEAVTERVPPFRKSWETIGPQKIVVIGSYRMGFVISSDPGGSKLTVFIDYKMPAGLFGGLLGRLFARPYARWCCSKMVEDAKAAFASVSA